MSPEASRPGLPPQTAIVITASDGSAAGEREDTSGRAVADRLTELGFTVERMVVPDDRPRLEATLVAAATRHRLVVTTGGTGLTPRDVTPQATLAVVDYEVPGIGEAMRADGRRQTPMAALSRGVVGVRGGSLIINLPGSPRGAMESLETVIPVLGHALETLAGPFDHARAGDRTDLPGTEAASTTGVSAATASSTGTPPSAARRGLASTPPRED